MPKDPYAGNLLRKDIYYAKRAVKGSLVVVLNGMQEQRELELIEIPTRAVCQSQLHELILTDDPEAAPGRRVDPISYLGFVEIEQGGVIGRGDKVWMDGLLIGKIVGFDETHCPNHLNIVIGCQSRVFAPELGAKLGSGMVFCRDNPPV